MCGIAGYAGNPGDLAYAHAVGSRMRDALAHRGPDDADIWSSDDGRVLLAHRRLSILDLSALGRNPMSWDGGRLRITYNGEVYNFRELRQELEDLGYRFRSQTDTEVILAAYDQWGTECLHRFVGMFAFALWDQPRERLFLARDRVGKKPLYYSHRNGRLAFASELKALAADPSFPRSVDSNAVRLYLRYGYVPAPYSIFTASRKLPPGHSATYERGCLTITQYWDPVAAALASPLNLSSDEADRQLELLLRDAVAGRMIADVPVGAFLSGDIDSSLVVALMQEVGSRRARTFTIKFDNPAYDESAYASAVAEHLGTEHHVERCGVREMIEVVDRLPDFFDEPFADSSAIPTYLVSQATRRHVTVALSGDGGDELFIGYPRYFFMDTASWLLGAPKPVRRTVAQMAAAAPWRRIRRAADVLRDDQDDRYARFITWWGGRDLVAVAGRAAENAVYRTALQRLGTLSPAAHGPILDLVSYLPEDILVKVDRASMAVSLETRCPLLDHRVAEFALRLPLHIRAAARVGKLPLRRLLAKRVPEALIDRPKMGFGVPLADWLRGPLGARLDSYLSGRTLPDLGLDPAPVRQLWDRFIRGKSHRTDRLWAVFSLCAWAERWRPDPVDASD